MTWKPHERAVWFARLDRYLVWSGAALAMAVFLSTLMVEGQWAARVLAGTILAVGVTWLVIASRVVLYLVARPDRVEGVDRQALYAYADALRELESRAGTLTPPTS